jgi:tRNA nucleotidyltransferase (CCA-adding enzyme)
MAHHWRMPYTTPMNIPIPQLNAIVEAIRAAGGEPLFVGGVVRDMLLGLPFDGDVDVEVYRLDADRLFEILSAFGRVDAVGRSFGVLKMRFPGGIELDFALPRRENKIGAGHRGFLALPDPTMSVREAAGRRDFTINAMALTPEGELLDFYGGQQDLRDRVLRHPTLAFAEDPLRVLRGMQFAARFNMRLAPETAALCRTMLPEASTLAIERVWGEWWKWASLSTHPAAGLRVLEESGWLSLYPELVALVDCPQDPEWHPEGSVWLHTQFVCDMAAALAERDGLEPQARAVLQLAALCHDLGKPSTTAVINGRIRSPGHDQAGVPLTTSLLKRIGCPREIIEQVEPLVREHMVHIGMPLADRAVRRLSARLSPATIEQWGRLIEADASGRPPLPPANPAQEYVDYARELSAAVGPPEPVLLGRHVLAAGLAKPGPELGAMLKQAYQAQLDGAFETVEDGLAWLSEMLQHK